MDRIPRFFMLAGGPATGRGPMKAARAGAEAGKPRARCVDRRRLLAEPVRRSFPELTAAAALRGGAS